MSTENLLTREFVDISRRISSSTTWSGNLSAIKDCWELNSKLKSEVLIVLDPTFTATLALPSEKAAKIASERFIGMLEMLISTQISVPDQIVLPFSSVEFQQGVDLDSLLYQHFAMKLDPSSLC